MGDVASPWKSHFKRTHVFDRARLQSRALRRALAERNTWRRAFLCLVGIGTPLVVGILLDQRQAALAAAVSGLLLYFADADGRLRDRFSILAQCAAGLVGGAAAGYVLAGHRPAFWISFAILSFAAGWCFRAGKAQAMAARIAAISLAVSANIPSIDTHESYYVAGVVALMALSRLGDHLLFGPLPQLQPAVRTRPPTHGGWLRFAAAYSAAAIAGLWLGITLDPIRAVWIVATTLFVMQPDARASYVRVVERTVGAVTGVVAAYLLASLLPSPAFLCAAALLIAPLAPHHLVSRYWLHTALIAIFILLAYDIAEFGSPAAHGIFVERLQDMLLGCGIALVATAAAFPYDDRPGRRRY